jgi:hypothetical protein
LDMAAPWYGRVSTERLVARVIGLKGLQLANLQPTFLMIGFIIIIV